MSLAVGGLLVAAVGVAAPTPSAAAVGCPADSGVTVVVDPHQLGGGVEQVCDPDGAGRSASEVLSDSGVELTWVQTLPGFVCRVDGRPTPEQDPCVRTPPADAFWSVWWSDGASGSWVYSSLGVESLEIPAGGYVGLSWQQGTAEAPPGPAPVARDTAPEATGDSSDPTNPVRPEDAAPTTGSGLPAWAPLGLIGALFVAGATVAVRRRRRGVAES